MCVAYKIAGGDYSDRLIYFWLTAGGGGLNADSENVVFDIDYPKLDEPLASLAYIVFFMF